jgi:hypothetical protein
MQKARKHGGSVAITALSSTEDPRAARDLIGCRGKLRPSSGNVGSPHAVPGGRGHDDWEFQCLRGPRKADNVMLEFCDRVVTHSTHETDLAINEEERGAIAIGLIP